MKTIKEESYKGHSIRVDAEYKEDAVKYSITPEANEDSIKIELYVSKEGRSLSRRVDEGSIRFGKTEKGKAFDLLNEKTNKIINKAKKDIDKKLREKEMTDGLPESLLGGVCGYTGAWGEGGKLAILHNDLILNKEDAEKLFKSAAESATLLGKSISEVMDSYIEFAKHGDKEEELSSIIRKICEDTIEAKEKQNTENLVNAIKNLSLAAIAKSK